MSLETITIKDLTDTVHRLQGECTDKMDLIEEQSKLIRLCNKRAGLYKDALQEVLNTLKYYSNIQTSQGITVNTKPAEAAVEFVNRTLTEVPKVTL